jgi:hypothetical protein
MQLGRGLGWSTYLLVLHASDIIVVLSCSLTLEVWAVASNVRKKNKAGTMHSLMSLHFVHAQSFSGRAMHLKMNVKDVWQFS